MVGKKTSKPERQMDSKDGTFCVYEIFRKEKQTIYYLRGGQASGLDKITLDGYVGLPAGLYLNKSGYGFGKKGVFLLSALKKHLSPDTRLEFTITDGSNKSLQKKSGATKVVLPYIDVKNLLVRLGRINEDSNQDLREAVGSFLSTKFPKQIAISSDDFDDYKGGEIAALLRRKQVTKKLNEEDLQALNVFFPKIFEASLRKKVAVLARDTLIRSTKATTDKIFLDQVIKEFEKNLSKKNFDEQSWQDFLREKVFKFFANYVTQIEKQNVSLDVSYPDFVLVDVYGFVDIFEIKRHTTPLLAFDKSHDNYYWKADAAMAIAQIENYIDKIVKNADEYIKTIKRKKGVDIRVIRPRGYIIAGSRQQLKTDKEFEDYRKLSSSLKNISFILYDELFENLKNLRSKL